MLKLIKFLVPWLTWYSGMNQKKKKKKKKTKEEEQKKESRHSPSFLHEGNATIPMQIRSVICNCVAHHAMELGVSFCR